MMVRYVRYAAALTRLLTAAKVTERRAHDAAAPPSGYTMRYPKRIFKQIAIGGFLFSKSLL
ncbi:hypothetical protein A6456_12245 [Paraburkholderia tropica]|nr:hypothetical protein A6456_12245 [Paraburkholderia tropica]